jgi:hypothetical protein
VMIWLHWDTTLHAMHFHLASNEKGNMHEAREFQQDCWFENTKHWHHYSWKPYPQQTQGSHHKGCNLATLCWMLDYSRNGTRGQHQAHKRQDCSSNKQAWSPSNGMNWEYVVGVGWEGLHLDTSHNSMIDLPNS